MRGAQVAGRSGGAAEAVVDGETGIVVDDPADPGEVASALRRLLSEPELRRSMGEAGRRRVVESYDYDDLSLRLAAALARDGRLRAHGGSEGDERGGTSHRAHGRRCDSKAVLRDRERCRAVPGLGR